MEDFIRAGADGVMLKPVKMDDLLQRLQKAIRKALEGKGARKVRRHTTQHNTTHTATSPQAPTNLHPLPSFSPLLPQPLQPVSSTIMAAMGTSGKHHAKGTTDKDFERRLAEWYRCASCD